MKDAFKDLMGNHRNLKFVSIDSTKLETSLEKKLGIQPVDGSHQLVHFTRYNVTGKAKVCYRYAGGDRVLSRALTGLRYSACLVVLYVHRPASQPFSAHPYSPSLADVARVVAFSSLPFLLI